MSNELVSQIRKLRGQRRSELRPPVALDELPFTSAGTLQIFSVVALNFAFSTVVPQSYR